MKVTEYAAVFCLLFINAKCRRGECPYGKNALNGNLPYFVVENVLKTALAVAEDFENDIEGNTEALRNYIETHNLTNDQPIYYILFTNKNPFDPYELTSDPESLRSSSYNDKDKTVFILPGFAPNPLLKRVSHSTFLSAGILKELKNGFLNAGDFNVIFPDFRAALGTTYYEAIRNSYLVAKNISSFIYFLVDNTATELKNIHLIGLSNGAQLAGNVGEFTPGLGRITGLEPASAVYSSLPDDMRLSRHDADFVDVIHTNGEYAPAGMGFFKPIGTIDFYVNGGRKQPNCNSTEPINQLPDDADEELARVCMHDRSIDYFITSTCRGCNYIGVACESYEEFELGICNKYNSRTARMGAFTTKPKYPLPGYLKFYVDTDDTWPYCRNNTIPRHFNQYA